MGDEEKIEEAQNPLFIEINEETGTLSKEKIFRYLAYYHRCKNEFKDVKVELEDDTEEDLKRAICDAFTHYYTSTLEFAL